MPLEVKTQLTITGRSAPEQVDYSVRNRSAGVDAVFDNEIGPLISHMYQVGVNLEYHLLFTLQNC